MVLGKHSGLQVGKIERSRSGEIDLLQEIAAGIVNQNRTGVKVADILAVAEHRSKLKGVLPGEVKRARGPFFDPFKATGAARFLTEVVTLVSRRSQHHVGSSLGRDATAHYSVCHRALKSPPPMASRSVSVKVVSWKSPFGVTGWGLK